MTTRELNSVQAGVGSAELDGDRKQRRKRWADVGDESDDAKEGDDERTEQRHDRHHRHRANVFFTRRTATPAQTRTRARNDAPVASRTRAGRKRRNT